MARVVFTINEPGHKRWLLGDGIHYYNAVMFGDMLHITVFPKTDITAVKFSKNIKLDDEDWQEQMFAAQKEADKLFPAKRAEFLVSSEGGGSVDVTLMYNDLVYYNSLDADAQRKHILHEAWRKLWDSDAKTMLEHLCNRLGVTAVKAAFESNAEITEI